MRRATVIKLALIVGTVRGLALLGLFYWMGRTL
jgi:hypothetical protein